MGGQRRYRYSLRFAMEPGFHEDDNFERLIRFCRAARIDDVMFFIAGEELNRGHPTLSETEPWMDMIARAKPRLEEIRVRTSINPWMTLLHADRGRTLARGQEFRLMVDPRGNRAAAVVCPLCETWRQYLQQIYASYATVKPWILWVEDDFRLHNHAPLEWGGCFCDAHMLEYSRRAGEKLTRERFVEGIVKPGEPHPYRAVWLQTSRDTMVDLARLIGKAVHAVSPDTRVGLMSSSPSVHSAEGRDWSGILEGLAGGTPMVDRIHLPSYEEVLPQEYLWHFNAVSRLTEAFLPVSTELYPELENFPHGIYTNSLRFTGFQLESAAVMDPNGITLNIFDMMGNGVREKEGYAEALSGSKELLSGLAALGLRGAERQGVKVLVNPDSAATVRTSKGASMDELYPNETFWAGLLSSLGISNAYDGGGNQSGAVVAVSGQYLRNLDGKRIEALFQRNAVLLEGEAAFTLFDMGLGRLAGIAEARWHSAEESFVSFEQASAGTTYDGLEEPRLSAQLPGADFLEIRYDGRAVVKGEMKNWRGETVGPGKAIFEGKVFIMPYGRFRRRPFSLLNPVVKEMLLEFLRSDALVAHPPYILDAPSVAVFSYGLPGSTVLLLVNAFNDDRSEIRVRVPGLRSAGIFEMSRRSPAPSRARCTVSGDLITLKSGLKAMEVKALVARHARG